jgi:CelD/BcsL family acetyltransferase involved in cellulose biosynthesis
MTKASALTTYAFERSTPETAPHALVAHGVVLSVVEDLHKLEAEWRAFEVEADATVFQHFDWLSTWQRHIGARRDVRPVIVAGRGERGRLLFLLPLAIQRIAFARELVWLGMDLCDYNGPLLAPDFSQRVGQDAFGALWPYILEALTAPPRLGFDLVRLEKMPATLGSQANPFLTLATTRNPSGAYLAPLARTWEDFYAAKRSGSTRRRDRAKRKSLEARGKLQFVEPGRDADRLATVDLLMQQKARSFERMGVSNLFARPGHGEFYRAISTTEIAHVSRLDVGEQPAAINLGLMARDRYYHVLASYTEDSELARLGPGTTHLMEMMANAIGRGFTVFDFTIGDEPYKREWCDGRETLYDHHSARTPAGALIVTLRRAGLRVKRTIKETPALWNAFYNFRAAGGRYFRRSSEG